MSDQLDMVYSTPEPTNLVLRFAPQGVAK
jgi:hypothetical protein